MKKVQVLSKIIIIKTKDFLTFFKKQKTNLTILILIVV
jgi:hypothetical protein